MRGRPLREIKCTLLEAQTTLQRVGPSPRCTRGRALHRRQSHLHPPPPPSGELPPCLLPFFSDTPLFLSTNRLPRFVPLFLFFWLFLPEGWWRSRAAWCGRQRPPPRCECRSSTRPVATMCPCCAPPPPRPACPSASASSLPVGSPGEPGWPGGSGAAEPSVLAAAPVGGWVASASCALWQRGMPLHALSLAPGAGQPLCGSTGASPPPLA